MTGTPGLYRKKPVTVEARQWDGTVAGATSLIDWILASDGTASYEDRPDAIWISVPGGSARAVPGDWIIKGVKGGFYPCKPGIFELTHEAQASPEAPPVVTVTRDGGRTESWTATVAAAAGGTLLIGDQAATGDLVPVAAYAEGQWTSAGRDDRRVPETPPTKGRAA